MRRVELERLRFLQRRRSLLVRRVLVLELVYQKVGLVRIRLGLRQKLEPPRIGLPEEAFDGLVNIERINRDVFLSERGNFDLLRLSGLAVQLVMRILNPVKTPVPDLLFHVFLLFLFLLLVFFFVIL